ncbi:cupin domain-containing protein [Roseisolibacter sp. H3M3-2]|uniref:cupin domain-containing protein n=1 Tax=Roseisolibacter sp. H3M3-2 TaxID=3031323 RepID=UPI0023DA1491|nr:cupin domain-containing protein [Roseisolibacter sp. H3M3-2]MDF1504824.1 cupin domain-containing protein [Roseisolibacter sp. H3M3-2]
MLPVIDLDAEFARLTDFWSPRVVARVNDQYVKVAKLQGEFVWHAHAEEDELFLVRRGRLVIQLEDGAVTLEPGQCVVVPRAVRHNPMAAEECWVVLVEPVATTHTGDVVVEGRTRSIAEQLAGRER